MTLTEDQIDNICERFELHWDLENSGPVYLCQFMESNGLQRPYDRRLLIALITVDIERNWLSWDEYVNRQSNTEVLGSLLERFHALPTLQRYKQALEITSTNDPDWLDLILSEAIARAHWGDAIGPAYFRHHFDTDVPDNACCPRHRLRVYSVCSMDSLEPTIEVPLRGLVRIGRQRSTDCLGVGWEELPEGNRVIVADKFERTISREQLTVQILNPQLAVIHNCSSSPTMGGLSDSALESGQSRLVSFPFIVKLPGRKLVFE